MRTFHITRLVREEYSIDALTEARAMKMLNRANSFSATVVKTTVREIPPREGNRSAPAIDSTSLTSKGEEG